MKENTTLRDQFAMATLGILVNDMLGDATYEETAREAYRYADAMLAVRDEVAMTVREAAHIVSIDGAADLVTRSIQAYRSRYQIAAKLHHPDFGGAPGKFAELQRARAVLDAHHGIAVNGGKL